VIVGVSVIQICPRQGPSFHAVIIAGQVEVVKVPIPIPVEILIAFGLHVVVIDEPVTVIIDAVAILHRVIPVTVVAVR
jgi:hypothetical protein